MSEIKNNLQFKDDKLHLEDEVVMKKVSGIPVNQEDETGTIDVDANIDIGGSASINGNVTVKGSVTIEGTSYKVIENPEYVWAIIDNDDKILCGIKNDGKFVADIDGINEKLQEAINQMQTIIDEAQDSIDEKIAAIDEKFDFISWVEDPEGRSEIKTDAEGKILSYRDSEGVMHENVGIESTKVITNSLNLTADGMTEFQQALKDSGFQPGGAGDFSGKDSIYIPEPRLAHLNIITDFDLTTLTKTSDVPVTLEFYDGAGNYFKKYGILNGQGRSSLYFVKKGLGIDFFNENPNNPDFNDDNTFSIKIGNWIPQDSFHIKSYYTDFPRCTGPIVYKLANEVFLTRDVLEDRPYKKYYVGEYSDRGDKNSQSDLTHNMETGAMCVPDGFPVIIYQNGEFWGVNSWQLKKHRDNYMLNKKKATHIHLDGYMGLQDEHGEMTDTSFLLWNGTIDWNRYASGINGIETRNPKNLYCVDGQKYDADTHDAEIITLATAEEWIAAGQIIPTGKVIDDTLAEYLRTTGKVRKSIENLTTYVPYIRSLISSGESVDNIRDAIEDRFDVNSFIDYILIQNVVGNWDAWNNNGQFITWGKLGESNNMNWSVNIYDCDLSFGCVVEGTIANDADRQKMGNDYPLYEFFWNYYYDDLKERYKELRDKKIFDADHIVNMFRNWMNRVGYENYKKEYKKWPESPCFRDGNKTYDTYPENGGFYGSIERIYLWIKKRIEYMDYTTYFDYNQN